MPKKKGMPSAKLMFSVKVDRRYNELIIAAREYLTNNNYNAGKTVLISDVFRFGLDLIAKKIDFEISENSIEFVDADTLPVKDVTPKEKLIQKMEASKEFRTEEYRLAGILDTKLLQEYDRDFKPKGLSLQEFIKFKELDL